MLKNRRLYRKNQTEETEQFQLNKDIFKQIVKYWGTTIQHLNDIVIKS